MRRATRRRCPVTPQALKSLTKLLKSLRAKTQQRAKPVTSQALKSLTKLFNSLRAKTQQRAKPVTPQALKSLTKLFNSLCAKTQQSAKQEKPCLQNNRPGHFCPGLSLFSRSRMVQFSDQKRFLKKLMIFLKNSMIFCQKLICPFGITSSSSKMSLPLQLLSQSPRDFSI